MKNLTLGVIGVDHRHIFGQLGKMLELGCKCKGWWTEGDPEPVAGLFAALSRRAAGCRPR